MSPGELYRLDELMSMTGLDGANLLPTVLELELQGRVTAGPGGAFSRISK
jgi:predicted Rossmann fold nucleotide-binding protein DprA/Smf involved in DNA uptake